MINKVIEVAYFGSSLVLRKLNLKYIYIYIYIYIKKNLFLYNFSKPDVKALYVLEFRDKCLATLFDNERSHLFIRDRILGGLRGYSRWIGSEESTKSP